MLLVEFMWILSLPLYSKSYTSLLHWAIETRLCTQSRAGLGPLVKNREGLLGLLGKSPQKKSLHFLKISSFEWAQN